MNFKKSLQPPSHYQICVAPAIGIAKVHHADFGHYNHDHTNPKITYMDSLPNFGLI